MRSSSLVSKAHKLVYDRFNTGSLAMLQKHGNKVPLFVTANLVTTCRLGLVFPTTLLLSTGHTWVPASLVIANAIFDYVDGAVARWEQQDPARKERIAANKPPSVPGLEISLKHQALSNNWGAYYDALADKMFAIPIWVCICVMNPAQPWIQLAASSHVLIESVSAFTRTQSFYLNPTMSNTVVTAGYKGKIKQAISMLGTALVLVPETQLVGGALLVASLPFSFASLKDKLPSSANSKAKVWVILDDSNKSHPARIVREIKPLLPTCEFYIVTNNTEQAEFWRNMGDFVHGVLVREVSPKAKFDRTELASVGGGTVWAETTNVLYNVDVDKPHVIVTQEA